MTEAAGYRLQDEDIARALKKYPPSKRVHPLQFSKEELELIKNSLQDLMQKYGYE